MNEFSEMLKKISVDEITSFLVYGVESGIDSFDTFNDRIKKADDKVLEILENMFPTASREDETFLSAIMDFSVIHDNVYFEVGLIMGFQMYKNMDNKYKKLKESKTESKARQSFIPMDDWEKSMKESLLNVLWDERMYTALESALQKDKKYNKARQSYGESLDRLDDIGLSENQHTMTDRAISGCNALGSEYGRVAYQQGFRDSLSLITELYHLSGNGTHGEC